MGAREARARRSRSELARFGMQSFSWESPSLRRCGTWRCVETQSTAKNPQSRGTGPSCKLLHRSGAEGGHVQRAGLQAGLHPGLHVRLLWQAAPSSTESAARADSHVGCLDHGTAISLSRDNTSSPFASSPAVSNAFAWNVNAAKGGARCTHAHGPTTERMYTCAHNNAYC